MHNIETSYNQFGFKGKHATDVCIYSLQNVTEYYWHKNSECSRLVWLVHGPYAATSVSFPAVHVALSIVANANISTFVPHVPSDIMLLVCKCSAMFGDTCLIVVWYSYVRNKPILSLYMNNM